MTKFFGVKKRVGLCKHADSWGCFYNSLRARYKSRKPSKWLIAVWLDLFGRKRYSAMAPDPLSLHCEAS